MKRFVALLAWLFGFLSLSHGVPVEWPKAAIRASILHDDSVMKIGQFLQLDRDLKKEEYGWKQMRIDLPDAWRISKVDVEEEGFAVFLNDQRVYRVSRSKIGDLSFLILDGGHKSEDELQKLWRPYEKRG